MTAADGAPLTTSTGSIPTRSGREVLTALSGLIAGMFVALISVTVVAPSMPRIVTDLGGDQAAYTWIITASMLSMTVTTPIWGKLSDLLNRKALVQISLVIFVFATVLAGFAQDTSWLIASRAIQGIGMGGLMSLVQIVVADLVSPRERGKYMGIVGAVMGVGQIGGPLLGGFITDGIGWRWNFWIFVPIAVVAFVMIQRTLHLPKRPPRPVKIDYFGAVLIAAGVLTLLIWVSQAGNDFEWVSWPSAIMLGSAILALIGAVIVEFNVAEPIIPMHLFKNRTFTLSVIASIATGVAMFGTSIFLSQYMQFARGESPTMSGLMILPMVLGQMLGGIIVGQLITRFGYWKRYVVGGGVALVVALYLMSTIAYDTNFALVAIYMFILGAGMGALMQNMVLVVQNSVEARNMGAASAGVAFFRTLGGATGVSVLGAILGAKVPELIKSGFQDLLTNDPTALTPEQLQAAQEQLSGGSFPDLASLPDPIRIIIESAYGASIAELFLVAVPIGLIALIAICFLPNKALSRKTNAQSLAEEASEVALEVAEELTGNDSPEAADAQLVLTGPISTIEPGREPGSTPRKD